MYNIGGDYTCKVGDDRDMLISKSTKNHTKELDPKRVRI